MVPSSKDVVLFCWHQPVFTMLNQVVWNTLESMANELGTIIWWMELDQTNKNSYNVTIPITKESK